MCCVGISRIARERHEIGEIRDSNTTLRSGVLCLGSGCRRSRANAMKSGNSENKARRADAALDFLHQRIDTLRARSFLVKRAGFEIDQQPLGCLV